MKRFPFAIYFIEVPTRFRVHAIVHAKRKPFLPARLRDGLASACSRWCTPSYFMSSEYRPT
jgi:hypothetical protein